MIPTGATGMKMKRESLRILSICENRIPESRLRGEFRKSLGFMILQVVKLIVKITLTIQCNWISLLIRINRRNRVFRGRNWFCEFNS